MSKNNWGRWGADDERGALNHLTPEVIQAAAASITTGKVYSLGIPIQGQGVPLLDYRGTPMRLTLQDGTDDGMGYATALGDWGDLGGYELESDWQAAAQRNAGRRRSDVRCGQGRHAAVHRFQNLVHDGIGLDGRMRYAAEPAAFAQDPARLVLEASARCM